MPVTGGRPINRTEAYEQAKRSALGLNIDMSTVPVVWPPLMDDDGMDKYDLGALLNRTMEEKLNRGRTMMYRHIFLTAHGLHAGNMCVLSHCLTDCGTDCGTDCPLTAHCAPRTDCTLTAHCLTDCTLTVLRLTNRTPTASLTALTAH
eukprot:5628031-Pyramimonas_sp.AAC.1